MVPVPGRAIILIEAEFKVLQPFYLLVDVILCTFFADDIFDHALWAKGSAMSQQRRRSFGQGETRRGNHVVGFILLPIGLLTQPYL